VKGLLLAGQVVFDNLMLIPAIIGKARFGISVLALCAQGLAARNLVLPSIDLVLAVLFAWAHAALRSHPQPDAH